jgi:hypothetical protein
LRSPLPDTGDATSTVLPGMAGSCGYSVPRILISPGSGLRGRCARHRVGN